MQAAQWIIAAITAIFVALVAFFQWRTAQQKAVLDLFEKRHAIYEIVREAVSTMGRDSHDFDQSREIKFMQVMERAYFFFGDDVVTYLKELWSDITYVISADMELKGPIDQATRGAISAKRAATLTRITQFHATGQPLFAKYMRFSQMVPKNLWHLFDLAILHTRRWFSK
jgi:hypothetical protein